MYVQMLFNVDVHKPTVCSSQMPLPDAAVRQAVTQYCQKCSFASQPTKHMLAKHEFGARAHVASTAVYGWASLMVRCGSALTLQGMTNTTFAVVPWIGHNGHASRNEHQDPEGQHAVPTQQRAAPVQGSGRRLCDSKLHECNLCRRLGATQQAHGRNAACKPARTEEDLGDMNLTIAHNSTRWLVWCSLQGMFSPQNLLKNRRTSAASKRSSTFATYTVRPHRSRSSYCTTDIM